VKFVQGAWIFV